MDPHAIADAYRRCYPLVRNRAFRILGDAAAAEDVAHETFMKLIEYSNKGTVIDNVPALLYRVATNLSLKRLRDSQRRHSLLTAKHPWREHPVDPTDDRIALRYVLAHVGEQEAQIAAYYYVDGLEQEEIATLLGMERRTVGRRLERFRERAQRLLGVTREIKRAV